MIEPKSPVTVKVRYHPYPAVLLASDENLPLKPKSVILRHHHLRQQQAVVQSKGASVGSSRPTRGVVIGTVGLSGDLPATTGLSNFERVAREQSRMDPAPVQSPISVAPQAVVPPAPSQPLVTGGAGAKVRTGPEPMKIPVIIPSSSKGKLVLTRNSHAIRSTSYKTIWYTTEGSDYLAAPIDVPGVEVGDLYVHFASDARQAWLRTPLHEWVTVEDKHPHPFLRDYLLRFLDNGEPRWVTRESFRTYTGREKKARREAQPDSS